MIGVMEKQTAVLVVSKVWVDEVCHLVNRGRSSGSTGDTHMLIAPLEDLNDPHGVWLSDIATNDLTKDGSEVKMKLMVPWAVIVAIGVLDKDQENVPMGFVSNRQSESC